MDKALEEGRDKREAVMETTLNKRDARRDTRDGREVIMEVSGCETAVITDTAQPKTADVGEERMPQSVVQGGENKPQTEIVGDGNGRENKPGKGRPKKEDLKLSRSINLKLTKADYETIVSKAAKAKMKPTVYAREMTLSGGVVSRYSAERLQGWPII